MSCRQWYPSRLILMHSFTTFYPLQYRIMKKVTVCRHFITSEVHCAHSLHVIKHIFLHQLRKMSLWITVYFTNGNCRHWDLIYWTKQIFSGVLVWLELTDLSFLGGCFACISSTSIAKSTGASLTRAGVLCAERRKMHARSRRNCHFWIWCWARSGRHSIWQDRNTEGRQHLR